MDGLLPSKQVHQAKVEFNPTVTLFIIFMMIFLGDIVLALTTPLFDGYRHVLLFVIQATCVYVLYTPLHEAVHRIANKNQTVNTAMLWSLGLPFMTSGALFRIIHLNHHAYTNQGDRDPDHFTSARSLGERWLRSFLLIFTYYGHLTKNNSKQVSKRRALIAAAFMPVTILSLCFVLKRLDVGLLGWILPSWTASGFLSFTLTAWPHHPGKSTSRVGNARVHLGSKTWQYLLINQNYHLVHHYKPSVPWYDYPNFWRQHGADLIAQGAQVTYAKSLDQHAS